MSGKPFLFSILGCLGVFYAVLIWALVVSFLNRVKRSRQEEQAEAQPEEPVTRTVFGHPVREKQLPGLAPYLEWMETKGDKFFSVLDE